MRVQIPPAASRSSSTAERWQYARAESSRRKKVSRCGEGARYLGRASRRKLGRLRVRDSLAPRGAIAQATLRGALVPAGKDTGMVQSRDTSMTTMGGAIRPAAVLTNSSRFEIVAAENCVAEFAAWQTKLEVVKCRVIRLSRWRSWVRIPPGPFNRPAAQCSVGRAPNVPDRMFPSSDLF
jgi:hypothetical protein